jgi:DHA3 family macrolide efflux protein-like MFS transporter
MRASEPWKKNVAFYLTSQVISLFGSMVVQSVMTWYITLETQSGLMMTIAVTCGFLPTFFILPFAGVWADRYEKKRLMIYADGLVAVATLGLAAAFLSGFKNILLIFTVMAVRGLGQGIQQPAVSAFIPRLVPKEHLMRVNSISASVQSGMMLLAPALAGGLMAFAPLGAIFMIDVITAALAITILTFFVHNEKEVQGPAVPRDNSTGYFQELKLGLRYIAHNRVLSALFIFNAAMMIMVAPIAMLSPLRVTRIFGADAWRLAAVDISFTAGMLLGGIVLMAWSGFRNRHSTITLGAFVFAGGTVAFGLIGHFGLFISLMVVVGVAMPIFSTPFTVLLHETVAPDYMGRVFSFSNMLGSLAMPAGLLVFGPFVDIIGLSALFIITGVVQLALSLLFMLNKPLRAAGQAAIANGL